MGGKGKEKGEKAPFAKGLWSFTAPPLEDELAIEKKKS